MANLQTLLPEQLTVQQVALILDMSVYSVRMKIERGGLESESMDIIPTKAVGEYIMNDMGYTQESAEQHIYNQIFE